ncbi:sensor histidine kinase [Formosa algae]|uniref:Two-component sensor histidine kinase/uncharacterized integral membrane protein n=1 Tax=Formosa algae TaxID=225843 RepID=A0A9X1CBK2_9FLAO|nr:histidine kinase [Formosa algae]MBP1840122.1 two-component sensor histidine kinase/uncharacterized integral membrane protein [Formosa algae]MDQ0335722.1 two-component sensor histidine kinase/uncharacterized integral membrane protein [Formosa algae]OEI79762.1 hypothetical protein AST99_12650 [Formosa algae]
MNKTVLIKQNSSFFDSVFAFIFWILLFVLPLIYQWINTDAIQWRLIFNVWIDYLPLLIIFSVNRFLLIPFFLFRNKKFIYFIMVLGVIGCTVFGSFTMRKAFLSQNASLAPRQTPLQFPNSNKNIAPQGQLSRHAPADMYPPYVNLILLSILLVGFDTGMKLSVKWAEMQRQKAEIEKESIKNELAFLRNQVSPHFLMNTLNNIHALVDFDTKEAKSSIAKLSVLMRHLLYEANDKPIALTKEIKFIESYVELMKLRFCEDVKIELHLPENPPNILIPTLLFTNILENAFKYGVSYEHESFIDITLSVHEHELKFNIENSLHEKFKTEENSGIGIENTQKRLKLLYQNNYTFDSVDHGNVFSSTIKIPI